MPRTLLAQSYFHKSSEHESGSPEADVYINICLVADLYDGNIEHILTHLQDYMLSRWRNVVRIPGFSESYYEAWNRRVELMEAEIQLLKKLQQGE